KLRENPEKEKQAVNKKETVDAKYQVYLATPAIKSRWRKPTVVILIICGIGLAIWGGYTISANRAAMADSGLSEENIDQATHIVDSSQQTKVDPPATQQNAAPSNYKYVLEVTKAPKVFKRFKQLQDTKLAPLLQLETSDSVQYKLFVVLPVRK